MISRPCPPSASSSQSGTRRGIESVEGDAAAALEARAAKRVAIQFHPRRTATWDHRKLGGTYYERGRPRRPALAFAPLMETLKG